MVFDDIYIRFRPYNAWLAYGQAKTANVPVRRGSDGSLAAEGITATALNPGGILKKPSVTWTAGSPRRPSSPESASYAEADLTALRTDPSEHGNGV